MPSSRKPRTMRPSLRRALVIVATVPLAATMLTAPSAAADPAAAQRSTAELDRDERKMARNLDIRIRDRRLGGRVSGVVIDAASDRRIWGHHAATALMPASNVKLATAVGALTVLGPDHRFTTKVVHGSGTLTLVGGGDHTLTTRDLGALAKDAVASLKRAGVTSVRVRVDGRLFPRPTRATGWKRGYHPGEVTPVRALAVAGHDVMDTSLDAGQVFARLLAQRGVTVTGGVNRGAAGARDVTVGQHRSAKLSRIVRRMLKVSDNDIAESLLRMTALGAGRPATFEGGTAAVRTVLSGTYGVSLANFRMYDGSGLSRATRIPAQTLAEILDLTVDPRHSRTLKHVADGLPVAGQRGATLGPEWGRFDTVASRCAVGKVRAKTGTLTGAIALSGMTKAQDGRWKVFSFVENGSPANPTATKDALDGLAATVNGCWA